MEQEQPSATYVITWKDGAQTCVVKLHTSSRTMMLAAEKLVELTELEYLLFRYMVRASLDRRRDFSKQVLIDQIWPQEAQRGIILDGRLHKHISNLRKKGASCIANNRNTYTILGVVRLEGDNTAIAPELTFYNFLVAVLTTVAVTASVTVVVRAVLTKSGWTITQAPRFGWVLGGLQGIAGALAWSLPLSIGFLYRWFRAGETYESWVRSLRKSLVYFALAGAVGLAGGLLVDILVMYAQQPISLLQAGWTRSESSSPTTIFTGTHLGWAEPLLGVVVCEACVATLLFVLQRPAWISLLEETPENLRSEQVLSQLFQIVARFGPWALFLVGAPVLLGAVGLFFLFGEQLTLVRFLGEGTVIAIAGVMFVIGMLFAIPLEAKGARIVGTPPV